MADCFAMEADDLHRRWLPREIFADLGILDTDVPTAAVTAAATPEAADPATVEELAVQLASIIGATAGNGGKGKVAPPPAPPVAAAPPPPPRPAAAASAPRHGAKQARPAVAKSNGGGNGAGPAAGAAVAWMPMPPYSPAPVHWQVPINFVYPGSALTYALLPPPPPCIVPAPPPPGAKLGTGVFLPRAGPYRPAPPPAKDVKAPNVKAPGPRELRLEAWWPGTGTAVQPPQKAAAAAPVQACTAVAAAALPQDWSYN